MQFLNKSTPRDATYKANTVIFTSPEFILFAMFTQITAQSCAQAREAQCTVPYSVRQLPVPGTARTGPAEDMTVDLISWTMTTGAANYITF